MATYTRLSRNLPALLSEGWSLFQSRTRGLRRDARNGAELARAVGKRYQQLTGSPLAGKRVLIVGFGQTLCEAFSFGVDNEVVGIDLDVPIRGLNPFDYVRA